jgi:hypothetical protein
LINFEVVKDVVFVDAAPLQRLGQTDIAESVVIASSDESRYKHGDVIYHPALAGVSVFYDDCKYRMIPEHQIVGWRAIAP